MQSLIKFVYPAMCDPEATFFLEEVVFNPIHIQLTVVVSLQANAEVSVCVLCEVRTKHI